MKNKPAAPKTPKKLVKTENTGGCEVCGEPYNYEGTGLCGPCCTGDADTLGEGVYTGEVA